MKARTRQELGKLMTVIGQRGGSPTPPPLPAPTGLSPDNVFTPDTTPTLTWDAVAGADDYAVIVYNAAGTPVFTDTEAPTGVTVSPALNPLNGPFTWTVFANPDGEVATGTFNVYILVDEFTTPVAAGAVNGTTADGTGQIRTVVDTNSRLSVSAGNGLEFVGAQTTDDPTIRYPQITRQAGIAIAWRVTIASGAVVFGVGTNTNGTGRPKDGVNFVTGQVRRRALDNNHRMLNSAYSNSVAYDCVVIYRVSGLWILIRGGAFTDWTLGYVDNLNTAAIFPAAGSVGIGGPFTYTAYSRRVRAAQLSAWTSQYANAAFYAATSTAGQVANANTGSNLVTHIITAQTGVTQEIMVRRVDDDNCIIVRMNQGASTIRVYRKEAGVETELTGGTTAQTWTNATSYTVRVSCFGSSIITYVGLDIKNEVTSSFQDSATGVKVSHAGTNFLIYDTAVTGVANDELDAFFPA